MADEKNRIVTEKMEKEVPKTVTEQRTVQEPKTVMEKQTIEVPKTVMEERQVEEQRTVMEKQTYERLISASCKTLDGYEVVDPQGQKLGTFDDVMLNLQTGRIEYAVISFGGGGLFGGGKRMIAVPWNALSVENAEEYSQGNPSKRMILNITKDKLDSAPEYNKGDWPEYPDNTWLDEHLYRPYGYHYYNQTEPDSRIRP